MRWWTREHLKSENGNALLMALSVIMVLTAFGTASLMTSVANLHMSASYRNWSQEYYTLDMNAEDKVHQLNTYLQNAESDAQAYMAGQYYLSDTSPSPTSIQPVLPSGNFQVSVLAQDYIYSEWSNTVAPYMQDLNNPNYQTVFQSFQNDIFKRLYLYYASEWLSEGGFNSVTYLNNPNESPGDYQTALFSGGTQGTLALSDGMPVVDINSSVPINGSYNSTSIGAIDPNSVSAKGKSVAVKVSVQIPTYQVLYQTKQIPIQGNPVWANAITATGNIGFVGGPTTIEGDIFSADSSETLPIDDNVVTANGIYSQGAEVNIYGNVYSKGNFHIIGSNSTLNVHNYQNMDVTLKKNIFSKNGLPDNLYFDLAAAGSITGGNVTDYIQDSIPPGQKYMPMVNKDASGGNVYCNSLAVEGSYPNQPNQTISNGNINVDGNVNNYNDIRMDGLKSEITVSQNNIGINSTADSTGDPNASSSVINNTPTMESRITLKGKFIVPGTAFAKYNGVKKAGDQLFTWNDKIYYQTGESISASNPNIFSAYMAAVCNPDNTKYNYYYDQYTDVSKPSSYDQTKDNTNIPSYYFMRAEGSSGSDILEPKIKQLVDFLSDKSVVTNIFSSSTVDGYSPGADLLHTSSTAPSATVFDPFSQYEDYVANQNAYGIFKTCLASIFKAKTQQLGTTKPLSNGNSFDGVFVDKGAIDTLLTEGGVSSSPTVTPSFVYRQQPSTLTLDGNYCGIIYSVGDLNIEGTGTFDGAIICEGNVTVSGSPKITYNEKVIKTTLLSYAGIRNFFAPGNMGVVTYSDYKVPSYDGAVRTTEVRYKILAWKEVQQ